LISCTSKSFFLGKQIFIFILIFLREEAAKQWSFREQEWNRENELREKLMRQLLDERQEQIINTLQILKIKLEDAYEKQRTLIADMEQARKYNLIEKQKQAKEREEKKQVKNLLTFFLF
jgi:hypothetical protein